HIVVFEWNFDIVAIVKPGWRRRAEKEGHVDAAAGLNGHRPGLGFVAGQGDADSVDARRQRRGEYVPVWVEREDSAACAQAKTAGAANDSKDARHEPPHGETQARQRRRCGDDAGIDERTTADVDHAYADGRPGGARHRSALLS